MINPITPIAAVPSKQILIESHSSSLPGLIASLKVLPHWLMNDLRPKTYHALEFSIAIPDAIFPFSLDKYLLILLTLAF
jgi:hypothetical protein